MTSAQVDALEAEFRERSRQATRDGDARGEMIWEVAADRLRETQREADANRQTIRAKSLGLRLTR